jgi:hypothetical protein
MLEGQSLGRGLFGQQPALAVRKLRVAKLALCHFKTRPRDCPSDASDQLRMRMNRDPLDTKLLRAGRLRRRGERLRRQPVERLHGELEVLLLRVLELRVREAAEALDEEHHRRDAGAGDLGRVV